MQLFGWLDKKNQKTMFFFEKKNQKTFLHDLVSVGTIASSVQILNQDKSLFASFSSEKEESVFLHFINENALR